MKAWDITIESDEGYWLLRVRTEDCDGGDCDFPFQLPPDVAEQLQRGVKREIQPYLDEREEARAAFRRGDDGWKPQHVLVEEAQDLLDSGVYDHDPAKRIWAEGVARGE